jgi:hypothetical protein
MSVKWKGGCACVIHGHPKKKGSKTDKPKGSNIKCYCKGSRKQKMKKAQAMHYAIIKSQKRRGR